MKTSLAEKINVKLHERITLLNKAITKIAISAGVTVCAGVDVDIDTILSAIEKKLKPFTPDNKPPVGSKVNSDINGNNEHTKVLSYTIASNKTIVTLETFDGCVLGIDINLWKYWPIDTRTDREKYIDDMADAIGEGACKVTIGKMYDVINK